MRFALRNQGKIAESLGEGYLRGHILASLGSYFGSESAMDSGDIYKGEKYDELWINDVGDRDSMLRFAILGIRWDVVRLAFMGKFKG